VKVENQAHYSNYKILAELAELFLWQKPLMFFSISFFVLLPTTFHTNLSISSLPAAK